MLAGREFTVEEATRETLYFATAEKKTSIVLAAANSRDRGGFTHLEYLPRHVLSALLHITSFQITVSLATLSDLWVCVDVWRRDFTRNTDKFVFKEGHILVRDVPICMRGLILACFALAQFD